MKTIKIKGMTCQHCVMAVKKALSALDGVRDVRVDLKTGEAVIEEEGSVDMQAIKEAIGKAGYAIV